MDMRGTDGGIIGDNILAFLEGTEEYHELTLRTTGLCIETKSCEVLNMKQDC
jgi:hypothetical protein